MNALRRQPGSHADKSLVVVFCALLAAALLVGGVRAQGGGCVLSEEMVTTFAERFDAIFDGPSLEIADEIFAPDFVAHLPLAPELDREGWKNWVASFYTGIPGVIEVANQVIVGADRVVLYLTYTATHDGPLFGIAATGKPVTMEAIGIFSFDENCLAAETWAVVDVAGVLAQIGAFPSTTAAAADIAQANPPIPAWQPTPGHR